MALQIEHSHGELRAIEITAGEDPHAKDGYACVEILDAAYPIRLSLYETTEIFTPEEFDEFIEALEMIRDEFA